MLILWWFIIVKIQCVSYEVLFVEFGRKLKHPETTISHWVLMDPSRIFNWQKSPIIYGPKDPGLLLKPMAMGPSIHNFRCDKNRIWLHKKIQNKSWLFFCRKSMKRTAFLSTNSTNWSSLTFYCGRQFYGYYANFFAFILSKKSLYRSCAERCLQ